MTKERFKELCNLIVSKEFIEFLNTITAQKGVIHVNARLKNNHTVEYLWNAHCNIIGINHGEYKFQK